MSQNYDTTKYDEKAKHGDASGEDLLSIHDLAKIRRDRLTEAAARGAHVVGNPDPGLAIPQADQVPGGKKYISIQEREDRNTDILKKAGV